MICSGVRARAIDSVELRGRLRAVWVAGSC